MEKHTGKREKRKSSIWQEGSFPKNCSCGAVYTADIWSVLTYCGIISGVCEGSSGRFFDDLELRKCRCGTSLAVKLVDPSCKHKCLP